MDHTGDRDLLRPENYPQSLPNYDPFQQDGEAYNQRLTDESKGLFSNNKHTRLEVYEGKDDKGKQYHDIIDSADSLNSYLKENGGKQKSRIFYIHRRDSLGSLQITEEVVRRLLNHFEIFPGFLDLLFEFGGKGRRSYGCKTTFQDFSCINFNSWEICYGLGFVERHHRERQSDPWSIRRTGVYQKHNFQTEENTWCLLHPSDAVQRRLRSTYGSLQSGFDREPLRKVAHLHLLFVSHATENWGLYIEYLEEIFLKMRNKALMYEVGSENPGFEIAFVDIQTMHNFEEKVLIIQSTLESNYEVLYSLQKKLEPYWNIDGGATPGVETRAGHHSFRGPLSFYLAQHGAKLKSISSLLKRIQGITGLFHRIHESSNNKLQENLLQQHCDHIIQISKLQHQEAEKRHREAEERCEEAKYITSLAKGSLKEAETMRKITVLGAIFYLPASLAASVLGMGYFHIRSFFHLKFDGEMWAYFIVTLFLAIITLVVFVLCGMGFRRQKQQGKAEADLERAKLSARSPQVGEKT